MPVVTDPENGKFNYVCETPVIPGATRQCGWVSYWWDSEDQATARGVQHENEHATGEPMQNQLLFEQEVGFERGPSETVLLGPDGEPIVGARIEPETTPDGAPIDTPVEG